VLITRVSAVVTVADFEGGLAWYERLFGRPADQRPMDGLAEWHHTESGAVQLVHDAERGGRALLTLGVDDLDALIAELSARGLTIGDVIEGVIARITSITDPEGNVITFAQLYAADRGAE
jgi:predicted enzyme related to lactoylglutathione lyase